MAMPAATRPRPQALPRCSSRPAAPLLLLPPEPPVEAKPLPDPSVAAGPLLVDDAALEEVAFTLGGLVAPHTFVFRHCSAQSLFPRPHAVMHLPCSIVQI